MFISCYQCPNGKDCANYCVIGGCNQCQINKLNNELICTDCPEGEIFNGVTCVQNTTLCSQGCSTNCDSNGVCLGNCKDGWTGDKCSDLCNQKCLTCSKSDKDICLQCKDDFYSVDCSLPCSQSCTKVVGKQTCGITYGYCLNGCVQRFWGDSCNHSCSDGCKNSVCDRKDGTCSGGCKDGYTGEKCTQILGLSDIRSFYHLIFMTLLINVLNCVINISQTHKYLRCNSYNCYFFACITYLSKLRSYIYLYSVLLNKCNDTIYLLKVCCVV